MFTFSDRYQNTLIELCNKIWLTFRVAKQMQFLVDCFDVAAGHFHEN